MLLRVLLWQYAAWVRGRVVHLLVPLLVQGSALL